MGARTRVQLRAAFVAATACRDHEGVTEVLLDAIEYDAAHLDEPRLMDELRAVGANLKAAA